jgi:hypothetical protein
VEARVEVAGKTLGEKEILTQLEIFRGPLWHETKVEEADIPEMDKAATGIIKVAVITAIVDIKLNNLVNITF